MPVPEQTFKKAGDLDTAAYADNLILVVSNPSIPEGPTKESQKIAVGDIRPKLFNWNPVTTPLLVNIPLVKNGDLLQVQGLVTEPILYENQHIQNDDFIHVIDKQTNVFHLIPNKAKRVMRLTLAVYDVDIEFYNTRANDKVFVDVTDGEVHCNLPTIHEDGDEVLFIPLAGNYALNSLYIHSTENLAGVINDPVRVNIENLPVRCTWVGDLNRWVLTAF